MPPALRRLLVSATIGLLPVAILAGAWRLGGVSALEDDLIYYLPIRQYIAERLQAGEFPLWNPLVAMGTSVAADPQSGLWYPATYLFVILPALLAYPVSLVLHFALAGGGMYRFLRACGRDWRAAFLGAVAFEFCGYLVAHRAHLTIHHTVAWLPWMLYGWQRFATRGSLRHAILASAAFGLQLLVQHVQISIISAVLVTGYVAVVLAGRRGRFFTCRTSPERQRGVGTPLACDPSLALGASRPAGSAGGNGPSDSGHGRCARLFWVYPLGMGLGALLAAVQLVPTWQQYAGSVRGAPSYYLFTENSWIPTSAPLLLLPMLQGARTPNSLWSQPWWGPSHFCEQSAYASILILVLAVASLRLLRLRKAPSAARPSDTWQFLRTPDPRIPRQLYSAGIFPGQPEATQLARRSFRHKMWLSVVQLARETWRELPYGWNREVVFWWAACLVALLIALGNLTPLGKLLFHVPLYRSLRVPARWILVWSTAMPVMASLVVSELLRNAESAYRLAKAVRFTAFRLLPIAAGVCLLLLYVAARQADVIAAAFPSTRTSSKLTGLLLTTRFNNAAIILPLLIMVSTGVLLLHWMRTRRNAVFALLFGVFLFDIALVAGLVDVDVRTYARSDIANPPPLATAIRNLNPHPGERLLVPRLESDYDRPIELLSPQSNLRWGIPTFNGYGPLGSTGQRMLFRFMPWGSSEEMLGLMRNDSLLEAMGVRFIAVRSEQERRLLEEAQWPVVVDATERSLAGAEQVKPARYGEDLLWGPVAITVPGIYELAFDVVPVKNSPSRWFVRLEQPDKSEIDHTRTIDPADMAAGPRRMRFVYHFDKPEPTLLVRVKSEIGEAFSAGRATLRMIGTDEPPDGTTSPRFTHRADLPGGIELYELPQAQPLVAWAERVEAVPDLVAAIERIERQAIEPTAATRLSVVEQPAGGATIPGVINGSVSVSRPTADVVQASVSSATGGLLVFNESYEAGWRATIGRQPAAVLRVNAVGQGVVVPPGEQLVCFSYRPPGLEAGMTLSAVAAGLLSGVLIWTQLRRRPARKLP